MTISPVGIALIKQFEGSRLEAYQDSVGIWTIGYGSTGPDIVEGTTWTQEQADEWLEEFLEHMCGVINKHVEVVLSQPQYDALCSFCYNLGVGTLVRSGLLGNINNDHFAAAADDFLKYCKAGGEVVPGLLRRREAERALFLSGTVL